MTCVERWQEDILEDVCDGCRHYRKVRERYSDPYGVREYWDMDCEGMEECDMVLEWLERHHCGDCHVWEVECHNE